MDKLRLESVSFSYGKGTPFYTKALDDVTVGFEAGKITGLIGHTGSGKSTMVQLFDGLSKPESGKVLLDGMDIWERPKEIRSVRFRVGLVMQYPEYQLFDETVRSDIAFAPRNMGLSEAEVDERVMWAARLTGVTEYLDASPFDLSGGQKRRAAIAGVLAMKPEVLVLDEPAAGLDPRGRRAILGGLDVYRRENNATIILVSHSMEDMALYCDDVVVMNKSRLFMQGTVEEVFSHADELTSVGLNVPQVARIASRLRAQGIPLEGRLYTVDGVRDAILSLLEKEDHHAL